LIEFTSFARHKPSTIISLLSQSYAAYLALDPQAAQTWPDDWAAYDRDVFEHSDTVGACGFVTCLDGELIGFASWDPRAFPAYGIVGHNCILPAFRGKGYGVVQVRRVLANLRTRGFRQARVTTGDHPFFEPARRMYEACGFLRIGHNSQHPHSAFGTIDYELSLQETGLEPVHDRERK
jgi:GNAT superfamily N-acetyltransferase